MSLRVVGFDIETTHLKANMGHILCAVAQPLDCKPMIWRIDKTPGFGKSAKSFVNDKPMVKGIIEYLSDTADVIVTHYGTYFDLPFVDTRAINWKLNPLPPIAHIDIWKVARKRLALTGNSQAAVCDLVSATHQKYKPGWDVWRKAQYGDRKALNVLTEYCANDVAGLMENYARLRPLILHHPFHSLTAPHACPACASDKTQKRGYRRTKRMRIERIQCQSCGTWFDGGKESV